jgi:uncharacterized FlgJ-related protein
MKTKKKLILTLLLSIFIITQSTSVPVEIDNFNVFSKIALKRLIYILEIQHPDIVFIQAQIESANFTSNIFRENNNLFGMKMAEKRKTMAVGINRGHAKYSSWQNSVLDYKLMQKKYAHNKTRDQYFVYLKKYAEDPNYVNKIKKRL